MLDRCRVGEDVGCEDGADAEGDGRVALPVGRIDPPSSGRSPDVRMRRMGPVASSFSWRIEAHSSLGTQATLSTEIIALNPYPLLPTRRAHRRDTLLNPLTPFENAPGEISGGEAGRLEIGLG